LKFKTSYFKKDVKVVKYFGGNNSEVSILKLVRQYLSQNPGVDEDLLIGEVIYRV
jgi:hypothetical protein